MARKFNDGQSNNRKSPSPYNQPPKNNKIQKNTKKDNQPQSNNFQKPQSSGPANLNAKPSFPPPPVQNPIQSKPISEAGKNNMAKLASINQLMGVNPAIIPKPVKNL
jgi:hypothetical protein